jgi:hypothetical protein
LSVLNAHFQFQKQQNSLIAGLRATNEMINMPETTKGNKNGPPDQESEAEVKETETRKQKLVTLPRSDSIGGSSGRKYLALTLSDPAARTEKERVATKKKIYRQTGTDCRVFRHCYVPIF